jgi:hypothetical protein
MQSAGSLGGLADVGSSGEDAERGCLEVWCRARGRLKQYRCRGRKPH